MGQGMSSNNFLGYIMEERRDMLGLVYGVAQM